MSARVAEQRERGENARKVFAWGPVPLRNRGREERDAQRNPEVTCCGPVEPAQMKLKRNGSMCGQTTAKSMMLPEFLGVTNAAKTGSVP